MLIRLADLPEALRQRVSDLRACVKDALDLFVKEQRAVRHRYSERSEASIVHDYMCLCAKDRFDWSLKRNLFVIRIEGFRAKLKKLGANWRPRNIQTQLVLQFEGQEPLRSGQSGQLFDDLDLTNLFLGYQRNEAEMQRSKIWLVCPDGKAFRWIAELTEEPGAAVGGIEFAIPPAVPAVVLDQPARRITPKKPAAERQQKERGRK